MKKLLQSLLAIATTSALATTALAANNGQEHKFESAQRPYLQAIPVPLDNTPFRPSDTIPNECHNPLVEKYIADLEAGRITFATAKADSTIPDKRKGCLMYDKDNNFVKNGTCSIDTAPAGFIWKELSDWPVTIGMTQSVVSDGTPHFHGQAECYYGLRGEAMTYAEKKDGSGGEFTRMLKGQYLYIPGNAIHDNVKMKEPGFGVLYWYPQDGHFAGFKYYFEKSVKNSRPAEAGFKLLNDIRRRDLGIGPSGTNKLFFDNLNKQHGK